MAWAIPVAMAAMGVGEIVSSLTNQPKEPAAPAVPDPSIAARQAQEQQDARRRSVLASGGKTDMTMGMAQFGAGQVQLKTLLGG